MNNLRTYVYRNFSPYFNVSNTLLNFLHVVKKRCILKMQSIRKLCLQIKALNLTFFVVTNTFIFTVVTKIDRKTWSTPEKHTMKDIFEEHLNNNTLPSIKSCQEALLRYPALKRRTAYQMILWVRNQNTTSYRTHSDNSKLQ